eukprot:GHVU01053755.1.p1 GENE.GHVU01053755.1~~GHVU01053755.1.p1  ORF type:complete len:149 (+),score=34.28 GHVU01053755.1:21-467(+)
MVAQKSFLITVHKVKISKTEKANLEGKKLFVAVSDDDSFQVSEPMPADKLGWKKVLGLMVDGTTITLALKDAETKGVWASTTMDCSEVFDKQPVPVDGSIKLQDSSGEVVAKVIYSAMHVPGLTVAEGSNDQMAAMAKGDDDDDFSSD